MSRTLKPQTLNFATQLLEMGRNLQLLGQNHAASRLLGRLSTFGELPKNLAEEAHLRLAELHLKHGLYKKARRQLAAALAIQPDNAQFHYLMADAAQEDDTCDPRRALLHFRRATKLDPDNPEYLCALGLYALGQGEAAEGLKALRRAGELAPDDPDVVRQVVQGLREEGETASAKELLQIALFRNPRDQRFRDLWTHHQFQLLRAEQRQTEPSKLPDKGRMILPFTQRTPDDNPQTTGKKRLRRDLPSGTPSPKLALRRRHSGKKSKP